MEQLRSEKREKYENQRKQEKIEEKFGFQAKNER